MLVALISSLTAVFGAVLGAVITIRSRRRQERLDIILAERRAREADESKLHERALEITKLELARSTGPWHSVAAHYMVTKSLLQTYDRDLDARDEQALAAAHTIVSRTYQSQCLWVTADLARRHLEATGSRCDLCRNFNPAHALRCESCGLRLKLDPIINMPDPLLDAEGSSSLAIDASMASPT